MTRMDTENDPPKLARRRGPVPQGGERYNVILDPDLAEWAKHQPGGMSETLRRLLREAKEKEGRKR